MINILINKRVKEYVKQFNTVTDKHIKGFYLGNHLIDSYDKDDVKLVKESIQLMNDNIDKVQLKFCCLSYENINFWTENQWYSNEVNIDGINIQPRRSELYELIKIYKRKVNGK